MNEFSKFSEMSINEIQNLEINLSISNVILALILSYICAELIAKIYRKYSHSLGNKYTLSEIFWLLATTTTLVITVVKFSLALSLGLVGALSIVRFRAAIKEPEELVYLFLVIGIGIAMGANQFAAGILITIFVVIIVPLVSKFRGNHRSGHSTIGQILYISGSNSARETLETNLNTILSDIDFELISNSINKNTFEATYSIPSEINEEQRNSLYKVIIEIGASARFSRNTVLEN